MRFDILNSPDTSFNNDVTRTDNRNMLIRSYVSTDNNMNDEGHVLMR